MSQAIATSNAAALTKLSIGTRLLETAVNSMVLEAVMTGQATLPVDQAILLGAAVSKFNGLVAEALAIEVKRLSPADDTSQAKPSMTREAFMKSWSEPTDQAGLAELKEMGEQPARLPDGVFMIRANSGEELPAHVAALLRDIFNGKAPGAAH